MKYLARIVHRWRSLKLHIAEFLVMSAINGDNLIPFHDRATDAADAIRDCLAMPYPRSKYEESK